MSVCSIDTCGRPIFSRGWCNSHYKRNWRYGDPLGGSRLLTPEQRFWAKVDKSGDCWEWRGSCTTGGYAHFALTHDRPVLGHRYAYELLVRPIPEGLHIDHLCRNRRCVRPDHMQPVTPGENIRRGLVGRYLNGMETHCLHGHEYSGDNVYVSPLGKRICRECGRARSKKAAAKRKADRQRRKSEKAE